jgi:hypothetical protein
MSGDMRRSPPLQPAPASLCFQFAQLAGRLLGKARNLGLLRVFRELRDGDVPSRIGCPVCRSLPRMVRCFACVSHETNTAVSRNPEAATGRALADH